MASTKPKPTKMKLLEGNPGKRPLPENEPEPDISSEVPEPPRHLSDSAKEEWYSISKKLHRIGLLTEIDCGALALYCQAYGRWADVEEQLKNSLMVLQTDNGNEYQSPLVGIAHRSMELCHKFLGEFGMTPSSRTKVKASEPKKKSKFSGLICNEGFNAKRNQG